MKSIITSALVLAISATSVPALTIKNDEGGWTPPYHKKFKAISRNGERVVIDGPCLSACTLVLRYVPHDRICVTPRAVLGIHRFSHDWHGRQPDYAATQMAIRGYPRLLQDWIAQHGGYAAMPGGRGKGYWTVQGSDLTKILKPC